MKRAYYFTLTFLFIFLIEAQLLATECSRYDFIGVVRAKKGEYKLVISENSKSEIKMAINLQSLNAFMPYLDKSFKGTILVNEKREIVSLINPELTFPDPLRINQREEIKKIGIEDCK